MRAAHSVISIMTIISIDDKGRENLREKGFHNKNNHKTAAAGSAVVMRRFFWPGPHFHIKSTQQLRV
jgi:hypothetical protein